MHDPDLALVIQLVRTKANTASLLKRGLTYGQVARLLHAAEQHGLIIDIGGTFSVTDSGERYLSRAPTAHGRTRQDGGWISPETESRLAPRRKDELYLPPPSHSVFEK